MPVMRDLIELFQLRFMRVLALIALIVGVGTKCFLSKIIVLDPDTWWHLCVGDWILQHRAFPHNGIFSYTAGNHPWMAYSWAYEILLGRAYHWFGFIGIGLFGTALTIAVAVAVFAMLHRISGRFWTAWALSIVVYSGFLFHIAPRPVFFTVIFFAATLTLLFEAQRWDDVRWLYWLPLVLLLWANSHIQFIYGLATVGLFAGINLLQHIAQHLRVYPDYLEKPSLPVSTPLLVFLTCILATCIGPYSYHLYGQVFAYGESKIIYKMIIEFQALSFKYFHQYLELLLAIAAYFAVGWRKKIDPFNLALLIFASVFAFRTWRDAWFLCLTAAAVIADAPAPEPERERGIGFPGWASVAIASVLLLTLAARNTDFNTRSLDHFISSEYPVDAANFLRRNPVGGPLYNSFDWGGFLIFYMPEYPVSVDGRTDVYGDAMIEQYYSTQEAEPSYKNDPVLNAAGVVILKNKFPLAKMLLTDNRFRMIYRDNIATVFARNW